MPKIIERGDPLVSSGFVGYVKKVKNERGTLSTKFALAGLGLSSLSSFISFSKKWYIRDEVCGLTKKIIIKKLATVRVGHFSLEKRRLKIGNDVTLVIKLTSYHRQYNVHLIG